ncbi:TRAP transporter large permease [Pelagibacterium luteolum]|uniref:TRAP transporter large permease protein n=1 Tax=Pelagibacterium luteolum TaxID=440168 RepID=A0A1G7XJ19_9HYPH|nr:TRAP transporter large permease [Pelagibacterium luteolum]SDG84147.1 C4-dicarboxylate transporter, DctM subunit [Pelagibacterium luteolum]
MMLASVMLGLLALLAISVPVGVAIGLISFAGLWSKGLPLIAASQAVFESLDSFSLMAVPFYILAGGVMQVGGISQRLVNFANALVGWVRGGLGAAAVLTSLMFSTISGSSSATTAAVGSTTIPAMVKKGYPKNYAAALVAASGELGVIIPPSLPIIIYGLVMNQSIATLFLAAIIPGLIIGASLIVTSIAAAYVQGFDTVVRVHPVEWLKNALIAGWKALFALLMPVIILGGIYSGAFTPTEAAVVAVAYGLVVSLFIYRELTWRDLGPIFVRSALISAGILLIVAFASALAFLLTISQIPQQIGLWLGSLTDNPLVFLLIVNVLLLVVGMFMETLAAIIILAPILGPIASNYGIDPIHFGIIMIVNLAVGMVTPPVGVNLFIACEVAGIRLDQIIKPLLLFLAVLVFNIFLLSYVPALSLVFVQ